MLLARIGHPHGATPLHYTMLIPDAQRALLTMRMLLDAGADPNGEDATGATPMHYVTLNRSATAARVLMHELVAAGGNVNATNRLGQTPLQWAAFVMHQACL